MIDSSTTSACLGPTRVQPGADSPEARFDRIIYMGKCLFRVPICGVQLVTMPEWGGEDALPADDPVQRHVGLTNDALSIPDLQADSRFAETANFDGAESIRFYAGCHLKGPGNTPVGTLYIGDSEPREFGEMDLQSLSDLAGWAELELQVMDLHRALLHRDAAYDNLQTAGERYTLAVDGSTDGIWDWGLATDVVHYSTRFKAMLGFDEGEFENVLSAWQSCIHPEDRDRVMNALKAHLDQRTPYDAEYRLEMKDGAYRWFRARGQAQWNLTDKATRMSGSITDVNDRKEAEIELEKARDAALAAARAKADFLANMSHKIRTRMNAIIGMTGLLLDTKLDEEQSDFADTIRPAGEALLDIINDILDFSKIEAGKLTFTDEAFDLRVTVEGTLHVMAERAHRKGLELAVWIENDVPAMVLGDPGRLRQVLINLVGNAVKFADEGEVTVRLRLEDEKDTETAIRFEVRDTGIGISKDQQERLFESFVQADGSSTRKYGGTGLGLSISKHIVERIGGTIGIDSEPGEGSTFHFTARFGKLAEPSKAAEEALAPLEGIHALIVDDNATNRKIVQYQLKKWGARFASASRGIEALVALRHEAKAGDPFDLIILDMQMPEMDGVTLAHEITADDSIPCPKMLMLTSMTNRTLQDDAKEAGVEVFLTKPVRQSELLDRLRRLMTPQKAESKLPDASHPPGGTPIDGADLIRPCRILLAEDNLVNQKVALRQLQKLGATADVANNGVEALAMLERGAYDLVLMDCQMPEMDGYETTTEIRKREAATGSHLPVIALTAHAMQDDKQRCIDAGMDAYISKPVKLDVPRSTIAQWHIAEAAEATAGTDAEEDPENSDSEPPPADLVQLNLAADDDPELWQELLDLYIKQTQKYVNDLRTAIQEGANADMERIAHSCAGSSAACGMVTMTPLVRELEAMGQKEERGEAPACFEKVCHEFERIRTFILEFNQNGENP